MTMGKKALAIALALGLSLSALPAYAAETGDAAAAEVVEATEPERDPEGTVSFENLETRMRGDGLSGRAIEEGIAAAQSPDYEALQEAMRPMLNNLAAAQWYATTSSVMADPYTANSLAQAYNSLRDSYDAMGNGDAAKTASDAVRQMESTENQLLLTGKSLYLNILEAEAGLETMRRGIRTLDRTVTEMELRHSLGQISDLALSQLQAQVSALQSQKKTLEMNISVAKLNLEQLIGAPLTGKIRLAALPELPEDFQTSMDLEKDLAAAKDKSFELYQAEETLKDARKEWNDVQRHAYSKDKQHSLYIQGQHQWNAAQLRHDGTVQGFELKFRVLYLRVLDYAQAYDAAKTALAAEELNYGAEQMKFSQGDLSESKLADAQDKVDAARDKVDAAYRSLFTAWVNYRWAVEHGVLN